MFGNMYVYKCAYMNSIPTDEEEVMNLKKSMEGYMGVFGIKEGKENIAIPLKSQKLNKILRLRQCFFNFS